MYNIMKFINVFAGVTGIEFTDDWKRNARNAVGVFANFVTLACTTYSVCYLYPSIDVLLLVGVFAFNLLVWIKLLFVISNHEKFTSVVQFIFKVFESNNYGRRECILIDVTEKIVYNLKLNVYSFVAGYLFASAYPVYYFITTGQLMLVNPMLMPFVDANHIQGYLFTTIFNLFVVFICLTICVSISSLFFWIVGAYRGLVSLIEYDFEEFDAVSVIKQGSKTNDAKFRNLMMQLMDLARFRSHVNNTYSVISAAQVSLSFFVVVLAISACFAFNYVTCLGSALSFYTEIIVYCYIGQLLDNSNNRIATVISNAQWYTYDVKYQKDMMVALYIAQNMEPIHMAGLLPLNFETGLNVSRCQHILNKNDNQITKNLYTLVMFMIEMFG